MKFPKILVLLALAVVLVACGKEANSAGKETNSTGKETKATARISASEPFRFGDAADASGTVTHETDAIPAGSTASVSFYVPDAPAGTQVRTVWKNLTGNATAPEQVKPTGDRGFVAFQQALPEGSYRVELFSKAPEAKQWQGMGSHTFKVGKKS
jgi:hypothetical protein